jgi:hydrogenase expression/formation protein HypD
VPVVVSGFAPAELLRGLLACVRRLEAGEPALENAYGRVVRPGGNTEARALLAELFRPVDRVWRGLGVIPGGGLALAPAWADLDAVRRFGLPDSADAAAGAGPCGCDDAGPCIAGAILQGHATPEACPAFGTTCTPEHPLGAPMVSSEGACAAWYRYRPAGRLSRQATPVPSIVTTKPSFTELPTESTAPEINV